jgi:transmembrane sensor
MNMRSSKLPKTEIVAEASAWFIEFRAGDATAEDRARFYEWLQRSPEHIQAYLEIAEGWAELPMSDPQGRIDVQGLIRRARESQHDNVVSLPSQPAARPEQPRRHIQKWAASFAGLAFLIGVFGWMLLYEANTYRTGIGEQRMVRLPDGSVVELNALSTVRVRLSDHAREIELAEGQALFHVAKDETRPFIVRSGETTVRAVGTQFDVYKKRTGTIVTVLEGRVAVGPHDADEAQSITTTEPRIGEEIFLAAGEQVTIPSGRVDGGAAVSRRHTDIAVTTAWVQNKLIFDETPLIEVAEEFNRYSTRRLVIADSELRSLGVSGVYSSTQPEALLGFLRAQPNITLSETDEEIRVALSAEN